MGEERPELQVVYLGISGVLHPSATLYEAVFGHLPAADGHREYEAAHVVERLLKDWPNARIILTSTLPWRDGFFSVLSDLGPNLACKVLGFTFADLTAKARLGPRGHPLGSADYWRLTKAEIIRLHVEWMKPSAWVAVDDETLMWTEAERRQHFAEVDGRVGLLDPGAQDRLLTKLHFNFGDPSPLPGTSKVP